MVSKCKYSAYFDVDQTKGVLHHGHVIYWLEAEALTDQNLWSLIGWLYADSERIEWRKNYTYR